MTRIYLLRHGQTQFNLKGLIQGSCDSKLTSLGIMQAKGVRQYLQQIDFAAIFCSTSERTLDTVTYATGGRSAVTPCKEFKEMDFGNVEGDDESQLFAGLACLDYSYLLIHDGWAANGGESGEDMTKRIFKKLDEIVTKYPYGNILIATHGGTIMNIVMNIAPAYANGNLPGPKNCSITIIDHDQDYRLIDYNLDVTNNINK